jgi:preprotein translocase subunit SecG
MKSRTFLVVAVVVAVLMLAMIYMHRPRSSNSTRTVAPHGTR